MHRNIRGFTLIEVLVVVSILGVLMGLVSVLVLKAGEKQRVNQTEQLVRTHLKIAIERYKQEFKRFPPMTIKELNLATKTYNWTQLSLDNETNLCNEVLFVALRHPDFGGRYEAGDAGIEDPVGNTDEDGWNDQPDGTDSDDARELLDAWGHPIVYISKNHYDTPVTIVNEAGEEVEVSARRKPNGDYYNPNSFQLISVGPNGVQDLEDPDLSDDIHNFTLEKE